MLKHFNRTQRKHNDRPAQILEEQSNEGIGTMVGGRERTLQGDTTIYDKKLKMNMICDKSTTIATEKNWQDWSGIRTGGKTREMGYMNTNKLPICKSLRLGTTNIYLRVSR